MNDVASNYKRGSSGRGRAVDVVRQMALLFLFKCLLIVLAAGCGVDQGVADRGGPGEDVETGSESASEESVVGETDTREEPNVGETDTRVDANMVSTFPQHDAPLRTDNGGLYFAGKLVLDEGCLRLEVPPDAYGQIRVEKPTDGNEPRRMGLLIWPSGFGSRVEGGSVSIVDADGRIFARVGDHVRLTHATIYYKAASDQGLLRGMSEDCDGPFYLVGDEVAVFDPDDEPTALRLSDPEVFFPRRRTGLPTRGLYREALGIGELVLDGPCLRLGAGTTIVWPAGFEPHVEKGVVQVRNWAGRVIAQVGDRIAGGGGFSSAGYGDCPGNTFEIHSIKVLPDAEVYFPTQDGTLSKGSWMQRFTGKLVLQGRCLVIDEAVRVYDRVNAPGDENLLIWPENFTLSLDEDVPGIVDASGRVVARVGDEIQVSAVAVTREEAVDHSGYREVSPDCGGGLWFVGEDFGAVEDGDDGVPLENNVEGPQINKVVRQDADSSPSPDSAIIAAETGLPDDLIERAMAFQDEFSAYASELISSFPDQISAVWMDSPLGVSGPNTRGNIRFVGEVPPQLTSRESVFLTGGGNISLADHKLRSEISAKTLRELGYDYFVTFFAPAENVMVVELQLMEGASRPSKSDIVAAIQERTEAEQLLQGRAAEVVGSDVDLRILTGSMPARTIQQPLRETDSEPAGMVE